MPDLIEKKVKLEKIIFAKAETSFVIGSFESEEEFFVGKGTLPFPQVGKTYTLEGVFVIDKKYGEQFNFQIAREQAPENEEDIEGLLCSDIIKGVGPKTAKLIIDEFGSNTLNVIEDNYEMLEKINGIGKKKAKEIHESYITHIEYAHISLKLQKMGIEPKYIVAIYEMYSGNSAEIIEENPYILVEDIHGMNFKKAEEIAKKIGYPEDSPNRIEAAIISVLKEENLRGHTFSSREEILNFVHEQLEVSRDDIEKSLDFLTLAAKIITDNLDGMELIYIWENYYAEVAICRKMAQLAMSNTPKHIFDINEEINLIEKKEKIFLSEEQRDGVKTALENNITIITGGPGTGKTTIINTILKILEKMDQKVALAAPTGRAAKRMTESSGKVASTIHRLLEFHYSDDDMLMSFGKNEENQLEFDSIIIDESSMVDLKLMEGLCNAIKPTTKLIMVGDTDQLPPVGAGSVMQDFLDSDCFSQVRLREIFRQASESQIVVSAHAINKGEMITANKRDGDFFFVEQIGEQALETVIELAEKRLPKFLQDCNPLRDIQVLTPMKRGVLGTHNLNNILQAIWNCESTKKKELKIGEKIFREGDKVIQIRNNYSMEYTIHAKTNFLREDDFENEGEGVFNGDIGYISTIDTEFRTMTVIYDDEKYVEYDWEEFDQLELAYALTVHKSQGSEFRAVIMPIVGVPKVLATRNLLYTGITRGKELVTLVGDKWLLGQMIQNKIDKGRNSALDIRMKNTIQENDDYFV